MLTEFALAVPATDANPGTSDTPGAGNSSNAGPSRRRRRHPLAAITPYLYLVPGLAGLAVWTYRPLVQTFQYSFDSWNLLPTTPRVNVGWHNYHRVLTLPQLGQAVRTTGLYLGAVLVIGVVLPVIIGSLAGGVGARARSTYQALIFVPVLVAPAVTAAVWEFLLAPHVGAVNRLATGLGFGSTNWLTQPNPARLSIMMMAGWKILGVSVLIVAAGLAAIDPKYYEAATIDGASRWQAFRRLTLPLLSPTILFMVITSVLLSSQIIFPLISTTTLGGPSGATTDIYYLLYTYGFTSFDVGTASAAAVLFFLAFGIVAVVCVRLLDRWSFHDN
jgi:multiple sugar transport system permease protein